MALLNLFEVSPRAAHLPLVVAAATSWSSANTDDKEFWIDHGMRLDHFLLSPKISKRLVDGGVDRWVREEVNASDHAPAWIVLDI